MTLKRHIANLLLILFIATYTGLGASLLSFSQPTVPPPKDACGQTCCCAPNPCMCEHADKTTQEAIIELADCHPVKKAIKTFSNSKKAGLYFRDFQASGCLVNSLCTLKLKGTQK